MRSCQSTSRGDKERSFPSQKRNLKSFIHPASSFIKEAVRMAALNTRERSCLFSRLFAKESQMCCLQKSSTARQPFLPTTVRRWESPPTPVSGVFKASFPSLLPIGLRREGRKQTAKGKLEGGRAGVASAYTGLFLFFRTARRHCCSMIGKRGEGKGDRGRALFSLPLRRRRRRRRLWPWERSDEDGERKTPAESGN